jgi:hypothetical protein
MKAEIVTNFTDLGPSWEAVSCAATQERPKILWNTNAHYGVHKSPLMVSILSQINTIHITSFSLSKIHFNIVKCISDYRRVLNW